MPYFVSYELIASGATVYWGQVIIRPDNNADILTCIEAIKNDAGGAEMYEIRVLCLTPLPS